MSTFKTWMPLWVLVAIGLLYFSTASIASASQVASSVADTQSCITTSHRAGIEFRCDGDGGQAVIIDLSNDAISVDVVMPTGIDVNNKTGDCQDVNTVATQRKNLNGLPDGTGERPDGPYYAPGCSTPDAENVYPTEKVAELANKKANAILAVNGDFFDSRLLGHGPQGLTIIDGKRLDGRENGDVDNDGVGIYDNATLRPSLTINGSSAYIQKLTLDQLTHLTHEVLGKGQMPNMDAIGGCPTLVVNGEAVNDAIQLGKDQKCESSVTGGNEYDHRMAVGLTSDGKLIILSVAKEITVNEMADRMVDLKAVTAMGLDGGGSTQMWYHDTSEGRYLDTPGRAVANAIVVSHTGKYSCSESVSAASTSGDCSDPGPTPTPAPPGDSGGNDGQRVRFFNNHGFVGFIEDFGTGPHNFSTDFLGFVLPSGWSMTTHYGRYQTEHERCWSASQDRVNDHEEFWNRTQSIYVYSTNVCPSSSKQVGFCKDENRGDCKNLGRGSYPNLKDQGRQDNVKSLNVADNMSVQLFKHSNFYGTVECFDSDRDRLPSDDHYDLYEEGSSAVVVDGDACYWRQLPVPILYAKEGLHGHSVGLGNQVGEFNFEDLAGVKSHMMDDAESATVPEGMSMIITDHYGGGGDSSGCLPPGRHDSLRDQIKNEGSHVRIFPNITCTTPPPHAPTNVRVAGSGSTSITLAWTDVPNDEYFPEGGYNIYHWNGSVYQKVATAPKDAEQVTVNGLACQVSHTFQVRAYATGESVPVRVSGTTSGCPTPPNRPLSVLVHTIDRGAVMVAWTDDSDNEDGFDVFMFDTNVAGYTKVGSVGANITNLRVGSLSCETQFSFIVVATSQGASSDQSKVAHGSTSGCLPNPPTDIVVSGITHDSVKVTWNDVSDNEDGFMVAMMDGDTVIEQWIEEPGSSSSGKEGLNCESTYTLRVWAFNQVGNSAYIEGSASTQPCPAVAPVVTGYNSGYDSLHIEWRDDNPDVGYWVAHHRWHYDSGWHGNWHWMGWPAESDRYSSADFPCSDVHLIRIYAVYENTDGSWYWLTTDQWIWNWSCYNSVRSATSTSSMEPLQEELESQIGDYTSTADNSVGETSTESNVIFLPLITR